MDEGKGSSFDRGAFTVIKEGETQILVQRKNRFFYNTSEVNIRDMSIAVLRTFITKRKQEHEAMQSSKTKVSVQPNLETKFQTDDVTMQDKKTIVDCQVPQHKLEDESTSVSKEEVEIRGGKGHRELIPPRVLDVLSATGLGALRYAREIDGIGQVVALDNDPLSVEACKRNIEFNGLSKSSKVESILVDARVYMLEHQNQFDVVDVDPLGTPSIFLDSAIQSIVDGGILMCTATDLSLLCGFDGEVCYSKYGSYPVRGKYCHEMSLRILLACIESHANRYKRYIVPVLSVQMDFYVRVFVRVYNSASKMKNTPLKLSYVYQCNGCVSFHLQPVGRTVVSKDTGSVSHLPGFGPAVSQECSVCGNKFIMGGPIWSAPIHDMDWVTSTLADVISTQNRYPAFGRIHPVLIKISKELHDVPLFVCLPNLAATLKCNIPPEAKFKNALISAGYRVSGSHVNPQAMKTNAPMDVIWDTMRSLGEKTSGET